MGCLRSIVHCEADAVEDGAATVSRFEVRNVSATLSRFSAEAEPQLRSTVKGHHGDLMRNAANHSFDHGSDPAVLVELLRGRATYRYDDDHQRERFAVEILLKPYFLRNAVVGHEKVVGFQGVDGRSGLGCDQSRAPESASSEPSGLSSPAIAEARCLLTVNCHDSVTRIAHRCQHLLHYTSPGQPNIFSSRH